jgi:PPOX class probable F420-dependent enzyme
MAEHPAPSIGGLAVDWSDRLGPHAAELLVEQNVAVVSTHGPDTRIRSRVVWVDTDGDCVLLNSTDNRSWVGDLRREPSVACTVVDLTNPYRFVSIEGVVEEITLDGAAAHIDRMAEKYLGIDRYPFHDPATPRVLIRVRPRRVLHMVPESTELTDGG